MKIIPAVILLLLGACDRISFSQDEKPPVAGTVNRTYEIIGAIPAPDGYERVVAAPGSFGYWLRNISLKKDKVVYLYNGVLKKNQSDQFAVLDIPVGKRDLQQCADAVMRLRAEYLFAQKRFEEIMFADNAGKEYKWEGGNDKIEFQNYLQHVFGWCGSASLEKQLKPVKGITAIQPGDVFIHGGFPGHAMIVVDMAANARGEKVFMLAQSYMPAQDIHIVKNPENKGLSPWYHAGATGELITPEWKFLAGELKTW